MSELYTNCRVFYCRSKLPLMLLIEALTPVNCQPEFSYERLETLGDGFLKYDTCLHVYHAYPHAHEGNIYIVNVLSLRLKVLYSMLALWDLEIVNAEPPVTE